MIEKVESNGNLSGLAFDIRTRRWVPCSKIEASFPSVQGAIAYAEEHGLDLVNQVRITEHVWDEK